MRLWDDAWVLLFDPSTLFLSSSDFLDLHCIVLAGLGYLRECSVVYGVMLDGSGV